MGLATIIHPRGGVYSSEPAAAYSIPFSAHVKRRDAPLQLVEHANFARREGAIEEGEAVGQADVVASPEPNAGLQPGKKRRRRGHSAASVAPTIAATIASN